jgi:hypothetical protein
MRLHSPVLGQPYTEGMNKDPYLSSSGPQSQALICWWKGQDKPWEVPDGLLAACAAFGLWPKSRLRLPGTYTLWGRGAWEARSLHEVPLGLTLQSGVAWQRDVRLWRE